jgi:hypothetical protein
VVNERVVRAAAGITLVIGAVAFSYAYFAKQYAPLQAAASLFCLEFLLRVTVGIRRSPVGILAHAMTLGQPPEWVSAKPKRFAWTLGLVMATAMTIITNSGIRGYLPRTICLICLTLMWMESALGLCWAAGSTVHSPGGGGCRTTPRSRSALTAPAVHPRTRRPRPLTRA